MGNPWIFNKQEEKIATLELALRNLRAAYLQNTQGYNYILFVLLVKFGFDVSQLQISTGA